MFAVLGGISSIYKAIFGYTQDVVDITDEQIVQVTELVIYPCRGVQGINLQEANVGLDGFEFDREWFLLKRESNRKTKKAGRRYVSINQNQLVPKTSWWFEDIEGIKHIVFSHPNQENDIKINTQNVPNKEIYIFKNLYGTELETYAEDEKCSQWFSEAIDEEVVLTRTTKTTGSTTNDYDFKLNIQKEDWMKIGHIHSAIHVVNQKSVDFLNSKIKDSDYHVTGNVFRPNIVISGIEHDEEDTLVEMNLVNENTTLRVTKLCVRCKTPTYNEKTGKLNDNGEPFRTLMDYKTHPSIGTVFGFFVQADKAFKIKGKVWFNDVLVGDKIRYTKKSTIPFETI